MKHLTEEDLILIYYNEPGVPAESRSHVVACSECQAAVESLRQTLDLCNDWNAPEPGAEFERSVWARLVPAMVAEPRGVHGKRQWFVPKVWVAVAAAVVLMAGAFSLGRLSKNGRTQTPVMAGLSNQARQRILEISLADHLDRAAMLLTEISNSDATRDFAVERSRAQDLVEEGRLMRQMLSLQKENVQGNSATAGFLDTGFLDDVERFLLEVANAPRSVGNGALDHDAVNADAIRQMRERIGSDSLLFKVKIIETNLRTQGQKL